MSSSCFYHPGTQAGATCVQCGMAICQNCTRNVSGASACARCASAVAARQPAPARISGSLGYTEPASPAAYPGYGGGLDPQSRAAVAKANMADAGDVVKGLALGTLIAIIGSILVLKIRFFAHFGLSWLYVGVGYGTGYGIYTFTRRGSAGLATAAVAIMVLGLLVGHLVYTQDMINLLQTEGRLPPGFNVITGFVPVLQSFNLMHWVCIAIGLGACYRGVEQQA